MREGVIVEQNRREKDPPQAVPYTIDRGEN
jgi:hypothetical protein